MLRTFISCVVVASLSGSVLADTLNISKGQPGYDSMVRNAALRSEGTINGVDPWTEGNIGNSPFGGSHRTYPDVNFPAGRGPRRFMAWFDVSSIPAGSTVHSATMSLYFARNNSSAPAVTGFKLSKLLPGKDWAEGVGQAPAVDGSVTWNSQVSYPVGNPSRVPWATPGATGATDIDLPSTITFDKAAGTSEWKDFDVTAWVQAWVNNPAHNTGAIMWGGTGVTATDSFHLIIGRGTTDQGGNNANGPKLLVDYTPIPEPATAALLGLGAVVLTGRRMKRSMV